MTLLILSDTHANYGRVRKLLKQYAGSVAAVLHLGDHDHDLLRFQGETALPLVAVAGNCDDDSLSPGQRVVEYGGRKLFLTHGNRMELHSGLGRLRACAQEAGADICLFGHTHQSMSMEQGGVFFINPGSLTTPRDNKPPSYALLHICEETGAVRAEILHIAKGLRQ